MSHEIPQGPRERDEDNGPIFRYEPDCPCRACQAERACFLSWKNHAIAKLGRMAIEEADEDKALYLMYQCKRALENWPPVPVILQ